MNGADVALRSALHWGKPLICRMGYMWSEFVNHENGVATKSLKVENKLFNSADRITVTTDEMKKNISDRIPNSKDKTLVIPNYVKTSGFKPNPEIKKEFDILFVGRLVPQKNIKALLIALHEIDAKMMIINKLDKGVKKFPSTFVRTDSGYKVVNDEGYVAIDTIKGDAVKLVDRLEFSYNNFNGIKNWDK